MRIYIYITLAVRTPFIRSIGSVWRAFLRMERSRGSCSSSQCAHVHRPAAATNLLYNISSLKVLLLSPSAAAYNKKPRAFIINSQIASSPQIYYIMFINILRRARDITEKFLGSVYICLRLEVVIHSQARGREIQFVPVDQFSSSRRWCEWEPRADIYGLVILHAAAQTSPRLGRCCKRVSYSLSALTWASLIFFFLLSRQLLVLSVARYACI